MGGHAEAHGSETDESDGWFGHFLFFFFPSLLVYCEDGMKRTNIMMNLSRTMDVDRREDRAGCRKLSDCIDPFRAFGCIG